MKRPIKLKSAAQQQQEAVTQQQSARQGAMEFATVEEMLRHDALHTPVPPAIAHRLKESIGPVSPGRAWWRRWFGKPV